MMEAKICQSIISSKMKANRIRKYMEEFATVTKTDPREHMAPALEERILEWVPRVSADA